VISRDTAILPRKLDWLLTERLEDIKVIMNDNGTYIQVPSVGSQASLITVFGDHRVNIERTIRSVMALVGVLLLRRREGRVGQGQRADSIPGLSILRRLVLALAGDL
jgi:hypothetical protein